MTINELQNIKENKIYSLRGICAVAGLNYDTIYSKVRRGTELSEAESEALEKALENKS